MKVSSQCTCLFLDKVAFHHMVIYNIAELPLQQILLQPCQCFNKATGNYCVFTHLVLFYSYALKKRSEIGKD